MSKLISPDYNTRFLLPPALEDWIKADHPVRFIRAFVEALNLAELGFRIPASLEGRPPYAPGLLLKIWLYGYLHRIRTMRALERACSNELPLLWLSGMISPDHNSLWRFWKENKKALRELFKQSVRLAAQNGLIGLAMQAIDGTKIQAVASGHSGWTKEQMEKLLAEAEQTAQEVEQHLEQAGPVEGATEYCLPAELQKPEQLREVVQKGLEQLQATNRKHFHPHEPEARRMQCEGRNRFAYNAQAVVDSKEHIVTAVAVSNAENDQGQLVPMLQAAQANAGGAAQVNTADSGYGRGSDLLAAQQAGYAVLTPICEGTPAANNPYHAHHFRYEESTQTVTCPLGQQLTYQRQAQQKGQEVRIYRCQCQDCPVRGQCTSDPKGRVIEIWPHTPVVQAQRAKLARPEEQRKWRARAGTVEWLFANIKQLWGFRRWTFRGLEGVQTQWAMLCLAMNLRKLFQYWKNSKLTFQIS
jgi:transposase